MIKVPGKVKYRSPNYDKVAQEWDKKYGGKESGVLSPAEMANKTRVRAWIDEQNNLRRRPEKGMQVPAKKKTQK